VIHEYESSGVSTLTPIGRNGSKRRKGEKGSSKARALDNKNHVKGRDRGMKRLEKKKAEINKIEKKYG